MSVATGGAHANGASAPGAYATYDYVAISSDGRYVAFSSAASNLVANDTNDDGDIFVHDRQTGTTERVNVATGGAQSVSGYGSYGAAISADGRYVAFASNQSDLVANDTNGSTDVFVHDRQTDTTVRASVDSTGTQHAGYSYLPSVSADGRYVAFESVAALVPGDMVFDDMFVRDLQTGTTEQVSVASDGTPGDNASDAGAISADGRYVSFESFASNLVPGDTNGAPDIFVHDRQMGTTERVDLSTAGTEIAGGAYGGTAISADGDRVAWQSIDSGVAPGDTNGAVDVFVARPGRGNDHAGLDDRHARTARR